MTAAESLQSPSGEEAARFKWTARAPVVKIIGALENARPGAARFVGGCVRDSLVGAEPKDIDVATTLTPHEVIEALKVAGLSAAPTGIDHGTITGIADHVGVEITTLRADVSTDGRRAIVAFTEDWAVDARRRDFTLNAIYLTTDGRLFDPVGGADDARKGRVRFIGAPEDRIREDYLRILRFFRFSARFAGGFDAEGLAACARLRGGIANLSAERIGDELTKILALPRAALAVDAMAAAGVLAEIWPAPVSRDTLRALKAIDPAAPATVGLAALWGEAGDGFDARLRLSNADAGRRKRALGAARRLSTTLDDKAQRALLYRLGEEAWRDGVLLAGARQGSGNEAWTKLLALPDRYRPPDFPLSGKDIINAGVEKGPMVAKVLKAVEEAWIAEDFPARARLDEIIDEQRTLSC